MEKRAKEDMNVHLGIYSQPLADEQGKEVTTGWMGSRADR